MKKLVSGEYCYVGNPEDKVKRIWLGEFNGTHLCVRCGDEDNFEKGYYYFKAVPWKICTPIEDEPEYYYIWEKVSNGIISTTSPVTDIAAEAHKYPKNGWIKNESTKRLALGENND